MSAVYGKRSWQACRSLARPLTVAGCERTAFILSAMFGAVTFNLLNAFLPGLLIFVTGYVISWQATRRDPHMMQVIRACASAKPPLRSRQAARGRVGDRDHPNHPLDFMTPITQSSRQRFDQAGSLAEELPYWGWVDKRTLLTRPGGLVTLAELHPCGIAGSSPDDLDHTLSSWMRLLGQLDDDVRLSLIVTRRPVQPGSVASIDNEQLPDAIFQSRAAEIIQRSGELRFFAAWTLDSKLQEAHSKGRLATSWLKRLTSNGKSQRRFIHESITRASERLQRIVDASRGLFTEVSPSTVLEEKEATAVFGDLINRPGTIPPVHEGGALHWSWGLSQLDGHRRHLTLDDEPLAIYSILEPPPKATANILWELLTLRATWTYVWEWQGLSTGKARGIIRSAQKHFFSSRYSMMAHARGTEGTDSALVDSAAGSGIRRARRSSRRAPNRWHPLGQTGRFALDPRPRPAAARRA